MQADPVDVFLGKGKIEKIIKFATLVIHSEAWGGSVRGEVGEKRRRGSGRRGEGWGW